MFLLTTRLNVVKRQSVPTQVTCNCQTGKGELNERRRAHSAGPLVWVRFSTALPATYVFLAFAFPFQALPLSTADERRHGRIAMFSLCKQTNVHAHTQTHQDICKGKTVATATTKHQTRQWGKEREINVRYICLVAL